MNTEIFAAYAGSCLWQKKRIAQFLADISVMEDRIFMKVET